MLNVGMTSLPNLSFIDAKSVFDTLLRFHNDTTRNKVFQTRNKQQFENLPVGKQSKNMEVFDFGSR